MVGRPLWEGDGRVYVSSHDLCFDTNDISSLYVSIYG